MMVVLVIGLIILGVALVIFGTDADNGWIVLGGFGLILAVIITGVVVSSKQEKKKCAEILAMSRTNSDSIRVLMECGKSDETVVVPMPIYMGR